MNSRPLLAKWVGRFFWLAILILIIVFVIGGFLIRQYLQSRGLSMEIISDQPEVNIGVPFKLTVNFGNQSQAVLKNAQLNLNLPEGAVALGETAGKRVLSKDLGDIGIGSLSSQSFNLLMIKSGTASLARFEASIFYGSSGIGQARFEQRQNLDLRVDDPCISLDLISPDQVLSGNKFDIKISYRNISQKDISGLELRLDYPASFAFSSANPKPTGDNNLWKLKDLTPDAEGDIIISGQLIGTANSFFDFNFKIVKDGKYLINEKSVSLTILSSPLELAVSLNKQENYIAQLGDQLSYSIFYENNSGIGLSNAVIKAKLIGEMFDFGSLQTNANFNSITNTLTWNASNASKLAVLSAGDADSVNFQIKAKNQFPIRRLGDKNYLLKIEAEINSPTVPNNLAMAQTVGLADLETKVAGLVKIESKAYFRDADSGIANSGPWPPKANQATQYTVHWRITNYATDISRVEARAFLESGVSWTGKVKSNINFSPVYNPQTQEIVWTIDKISATKGITSQAIEAIFQIEALPNINQVGNYQPLIRETNIFASDDFTGKTLQNQSAGITTALPDDLTVQQTKGIVQ